MSGGGGGLYGEVPFLEGVRGRGLYSEYPFLEGGVGVGAPYIKIQSIMGNGHIAPPPPENDIFMQKQRKPRETRTLDPQGKTGFLSCGINSAKAFWAPTHRSPVARSTLMLSRLASIGYVYNKRRHLLDMVGPSSVSFMYFKNAQSSV